MLYLRIEDPTAELLRELEAIDRKLQAEIRAANQEIGATVSGEAKRILVSEIQNVPIPLTKGADAKLGAKHRDRTRTTKGNEAGQWSRSGNLVKQESFRVSSDGSEVTLHNNANYAAARAALGGPNPPNAKGRKAGEQRPQTDKPPAQRSKTKAVGNWQERAVKLHQGFIRKRYEQAVERALDEATR